MAAAQAVELLCAAIRDTNWEVRKMATEALVKIGDVRAVEPLCAALKDGNWNVREEAAEALAKIGDARTMEPLCAALADTEYLVRETFVGDGANIYIHDLERDTTSRLTFTGPSEAPIWAPDGKHLVFQSASNRFSFFWARSDGTGEPQRLLESKNVVLPWSFSPDGRRLAYRERNPDTGIDLWTLALDLTDPDYPKPGKPELFLGTSADAIVQSFSPDGRWIAYRSDESGSVEIYVRPFPTGSGGKWQISVGGGLYPLWSNNRRELFYENADRRIMVVDYTVEGDSFVPGKPRVWSDKQLFYPGTSNLDLAPDGKRFAVFALPEAAPGDKGSVHVTMLLNFFDEVRRRIPAGGK